jgi:hypothetical protein
MGMRSGKRARHACIALAVTLVGVLASASPSMGSDYWPGRIQMAFATWLVRSPESKVLIGYLVMPLSWKDPVSGEYASDLFMFKGRCRWDHHGGLSCGGRPPNVGPTTFEEKAFHIDPLLQSAYLRVRTPYTPSYRQSVTWVPRVPPSIALGFVSGDAEGVLIGQRADVYGKLFGDRLTPAQQFDRFLPAWFGYGQNITYPESCADVLRIAQSLSDGRMSVGPGCQAHWSFKVRTHRPG